MTTTSEAPGTASAQPPAAVRPRAWPAALAGTTAAAMALAVGELFAGLVGPAPSLVYSVGDAVIDVGAGSPVKDLAVAVFGTADKTALVVGTVVLVLVAGAGLGVLADRRSLRPAAAGIALIGALGVAATIANPLRDAGWAAVVALAVIGAGIISLRALLRLAARLRVTEAPTPSPTFDPSRARREFLRISLAVLAAAGLAGSAGRFLAGRSEADAVRAALVLPDAASAGGVVETTAFTGIDGLTPLFTPNEAFYRIDTALMVPVVDVPSWTLRVHGMVERDVVLTFDDLLALPQMEADVTIACVSNEVGGDLIGNARWQGVRLATVLEMAGVDPAATQVVGRSVDGWTAGFPTDIAFDGRDAMIAVAMNGEPLPLPHGFPARLIVPGLYGYVSATKWLSDIELTTWEAFDGYWVPRGWSKEGPIKTQSRIDVPRRGQDVEAGPVVIAGVAWAQRRGVARVEVQVDDGPWQDAELAEALSVDTWRQWRLRWDATSGQHTIRVRATDGEGMTQSEARVPVAPDGAEGYHSRSVRVV